MSKMAELDSDRQQIDRLTDAVRPPSFAESARAGAPAHTPTPWIEVGSHDFRGANMNLVGMVNPTVRQGKIDRAFIVKAVNNHDALATALADTLCELTACASQLAVRGLKGREGDSVSRAQKAAREALAALRDSRP